MRNTTKKKVEQLIEMRKNGATNKEVAKRLGVSQSVVNYYATLAKKNGKKTDNTQKALINPAVSPQLVTGAILALYGLPFDVAQAVRGLK